MLVPYNCSTVLLLSFESTITSIAELACSTWNSLAMSKQSKPPPLTGRRDQAVNLPTSNVPQDVSLDYEYAQADGMEVEGNEGMPLLDLKKRSVRHGSAGFGESELKRRDLLSSSVWSRYKLSVRPVNTTSTSSSPSSHLLFLKRNQVPNRGLRTRPTITPPKPRHLPLRHSQIPSKKQKKTLFHHID
jgi:hypothetical protein